MNAVDELLDYGRQMIETEARNETAERAMREAQGEARIERAGQALLKALELDEEAFAGFMPSAEEPGYSKALNVMFTLRYLNHELQVRVFEPQRNGSEALTVEVQNVKAQSPRAALAKWLVEVRAKFEERKREVIYRLNVAESAFYGDYTWQSMNRIDVWGEPEVVEARMAYLLKHRPEQGWRNEQDFTEWLQAAEVLKGYAEIGASIEPVKCNLKYVQEWARLMRMLKERHDPVTGEQRGIEYDADYGLRIKPVTVDEIEHYQAAIDEAGIWTDEIVEALALFHKKLDQQKVEEEREAKRAALEAEVFYPFQYYEVEYGVMTDDDEGELKIDVDGFMAVSDRPDANGYFTKVNGTKVKPAHVVTITRRECLTLEAMTGRLVRHMPTEFGEVRVPPAGVERIG